MLIIRQEFLNRYKWGGIPSKDFDFANLDEVFLLKSERCKERVYCPKYEIYYKVIPANRKRKITCKFKFDDEGRYLGMDTRCTASKKQIKEWEDEALEWLLNNGILTEMFGQRR